MLVYQSDRSIFPDDYNIKLYEMWNDDKRWPGNAHAHTYVQLWYIQKGRCIHEINGEVYEVNEGELFIIPPLVEHKISIEKTGCAIYGCDFPLEVLSEDSLICGEQNATKEDFLGNLLRVRGKYTLPEVMRSRVESTLKKMLNVYLKRQPYGIIELKGYLLRLLVNILQTLEDDESLISDKDAYAGNINDAINYTNEHIADRIYLKDIAKYAKMSVSSFNYYFKKYTGKTYVDYVNMVRLDVAKTLLIETGLGISTIGQRVGFADCAYFNRQFKKYVGCTPGEYRNCNRDM